VAFANVRPVGCRTRMVIARRDRIRHAGRVADLYDLGDYDETFVDLAGICLEDSWVLGIEESCTALVFLFDAVLTPDHRAYQPSKPTAAVEQSSISPAPPRSTFAALRRRPPWTPRENQITATSTAFASCGTSGGWSGS
jgi:hypothetical protein